MLEALLKGKRIKNFVRKVRSFESMLAEAFAFVIVPIIAIQMLITESASIDQATIDQIQNDIIYNRQLINNQSIILNEIVGTQNMSINRISDEIITLKNDVFTIKNDLKDNKLEIRFTNLIQSIFLKIFNERDISNTLTNLVFEPKMTDVLKIINRDIILRDMKELNENFHPANKPLKNWNDILEILAVSEVNIVKYEDNITIFIDIPFYKQNWTLFEIVPIVFKGEGMPIEITKAKKFMIRGESRYSLLSGEDLKNCKLLGLLFVCSFIPIKPTVPTCENNVYAHDELDLCETSQAIHKSKVIQTDRQTFFINTHEEIEIIWSCPGLGVDNEQRIAENAWIKLNPGCYFETLNKTYYISDIKPIMEIDFPTEKINLSEENWTPGYDTENPHESNMTQDLHVKIDKISKMVNSSQERSNVQVERIRLPIKIITLSIGTIIICVGIISLCICIY